MLDRLVDISDLCLGELVEPKLGCNPRSSVKDTGESMFEDVRLLINSLPFHTVGPVATSGNPSGSGSLSGLTYDAWLSAQSFSLGS